MRQLVLVAPLLAALCAHAQHRDPGATTAPSLECRDFERLSYPDGRAVCLADTRLGELTPPAYRLPLKRLMPSHGYASISAVTGSSSCSTTVFLVIGFPSQFSNPDPANGAMQRRMRSERSLAQCKAAIRAVDTEQGCACKLITEDGAIVAEVGDFEDRYGSLQKPPVQRVRPNTPDGPTPLPRPNIRAEEPLPRFPNAVATRTPPSTTSASGSGFAVNARQVVTNQHVIEGCKQVQIRRGDLIEEAVISASSVNDDLAVVTTSADLGETVAIRAAGRLGEEVMAAGYPLSGLLGAGLVVTMGQINSLSGIRDDRARFQFSAPVQFGSSGGPLIDRSGQVVGVVVGGINALRVGRVIGDIPQNINFGIKPEVLRRFLDLNKVSYAVSVDARPVRDNVALAELAQSVTVQVVCR